MLTPNCREARVVPSANDTLLDQVLQLPLRQNRIDKIDAAMSGQTRPIGTSLCEPEIKDLDLREA